MDVEINGPLINAGSSFSNLKNIGSKVPDIMEAIIVASKPKDTTIASILSPS